MFVRVRVKTSSFRECAELPSSHANKLHSVEEQVGPPPPGDHGDLAEQFLFRDCCCCFGFTPEGPDGSSSSVRSTPGHKLRYLT